MLKQNQVDPRGELNAVRARGTLMGNRGILHNEQQHIVAPWRHKRWIACSLEYQGTKRVVFSPGQYSELFFLDEATAYSAGHRPCAQCRREDYKRFYAAWTSANIDFGANAGMSVAGIDAILHAERAIRGGGKMTYEADLNSLPPGTFVVWNGSPHLIRNTWLLPWSFEGYGERLPINRPNTTVTVLTPPSVVRLFKSGFYPKVHSSGDIVPNGGL